MSSIAFSRRIARSCVQFIKHFRNFSEGSGKITTSYYHEKGTFSFRQSTLGDLIDEAAEDSGDNVGLVFTFQNIRKTYYEFKEETDQLAAGLISLGLNLGDRIAIYGPNSYQWLLTQYAALKAGLVVVNVNSAYTEQELSYTLGKIGCRAIVSAESFKTRDYYKTLCEAIPELPNSQQREINSQKLRQLQKVIMISDKVYPGTYKLEEVMKADGSDARRRLNETRKKLQFDSPAIVMFTSGTTGTPKGATISHFQVVNQSRSAVKRVEFDKERPVICLPVPLFHAFGSVVGFPASVTSRGTTVFPSQHFNPVSCIRTIQEEKCNVVYGVPTMFIEIVSHLRNKQYDIRHWKKVVVGATPVPMELKKCLQDEFGLTVMIGYGATETTATLSSQSPLDSRTTGDSSGKPIEHVEVKIVDEQGHIVPVNTTGEILSRSPFIFIGYWDQAEKTAEVIDNARWYHTGDVGRMDEEGNVYITGRIKDMVIRGGENIYPTEIENFLLTHPSIADVYVVGVPDKRLGEELCASIKLKTGCTVIEDEIKAFCKDKISYFKIPRYIIFCEDFPKTESGKIKKHELRKICAKSLNL